MAYSWQRVPNTSFVMKTPYIANRLSFHSLNFDKKFVKYCKKLKENYTCISKIEKKKQKKQANSKKTKRWLLVTFWNHFFFQLIQRKYLQIDWKVYNLSQLSKPKQRVNFKT